VLWSRKLFVVCTRNRRCPRISPRFYARFPRRFLSGKIIRTTLLLPSGNISHSAANTPVICIRCLLTALRNNVGFTRADPAKKASTLMHPRYRFLLGDLERQRPLVLQKTEVSWK
jgi:hypothetical protein